MQTSLGPIRTRHDARRVSLERDGVRGVSEGGLGRGRTHIYIYIYIFIYFFYIYNVVAKEPLRDSPRTVSRGFKWSFHTSVSAFGCE